MRYEATVRYEGKSVTFKVTNQILQGRFELKDFLKSVRESRNHCIQTVSVKPTTFIVSFPHIFEVPLPLYLHSKTIPEPV